MAAGPRSPRSSRLREDGAAPGLSRQGAATDREIWPPLGRGVAALREVVEAVERLATPVLLVLAELRRGLAGRSGGRSASSCDDDAASMLRLVALCPPQ